MRRTSPTLVLLVSLLSATACDTDTDDAAVSGDAGSGGNAGAGGNGGSALCDVVDCSGHGTCVPVAGEALAECDCDDGYTASGLDCIPSGSLAPAPPEGFTCPAPGAGTEPVFTQFTANRLYYTWNDKTCGTPSWRMIYTFRPDGVFLIQSQFQAAVGSASGNLDYGCYTYTVEGESLRVNYSYSNESFRNCTMLGSLADPPCSGLVTPRAEGGFVQADSLADNQETQVFWPLTDAACVWCSNAESCCPENSWIADSIGPVCP